jgi:hypothetical protein
MFVWDDSRVAKTRRRTRNVVAAIAVAAFLGIALFGILSWRSVTVERADPDQAVTRFALARERFTGVEAIVRVDVGGNVVRRVPPDGETPSPKHLYALAYRQADRRLVRVDVPFWFLRVKGPAMQYSLRETGFDLERLGITPADLRRYGAALVLDETRGNGDRLLVWTE